MISEMSNSWLQHPLTRGLDIDDPQTTQMRYRIIRQKSFLKKIYAEWYKLVIAFLPSDQDGDILELGSGAGFLKDFIPEAITSDVFCTSGVDVVLDGCQMPFEEKTLRGIILINVFHHLPRPKSFLMEAARCIKQGGVIVMIEPWVSSWSRWVYQHLHHEHCEPEAKEWGVQNIGPLSGANSALAWIVFQRDRELFDSEFPQLKIQTIKPLMPFRYLISGGVSHRSLQPGWSYGFWCKFEEILRPIWNKTSMFACIAITRV